MPRADKVAEVTRLAEKFRSSEAVVLTEYRGLSMAEISELRRSLGTDVSYTVVKNTLAKRAAQEAGADVLVEEFTGPSALAFVTGDPVEAARGLRDFSKAHSQLVLRGGLLSGRFLDAAEVGRLADLESREVLLAKLAGAMKASLTSAVSMLAAPLSQTARAVEALRAQVEQTAPAADAAAEPTADAAAEPAGEPTAEAAGEPSPEPAPSEAAASPATD